MKTLRHKIVLLVILLALGTLWLKVWAENSSGTTVRVSLNSMGQEGNDWSENASISADGQYVVFQSWASNLVPGDFNGSSDVFIHDLDTGTTEVIGLGFSGSGWPKLSFDSRYVAYYSGNPYVPEDLNDTADVYLYDRWTFDIELISLSNEGEGGYYESFYPAISSDGRYVTFVSASPNLVPDDTNGKWDIFIRDRQLEITERVSLSSTDTQGDDDSGLSSVSSDGRYVAFASLADNLVVDDANGDIDIFLRDRQAGTTTMISRGLDGQPGNDDSNRPVISANGRFVAFYSRASNLVADDTNNRSDVFVYDRATGSLERVSLSSAGQQSNDNSTIPAISADGRFVIFSSVASNLVIGDTNNASDVFRHDRWTGVTERLSLTWQDQEALGVSVEPAVSPDGRFVAFTSNSDNLVPNDTNETYDVFVRDQPYALLDTNHSGGGPGSYFSLTAAHFPPTVTATITVNGLSLGTVATDGSGQAAFQLDTTTADPGYYQVTLTAAPYWARAEFILYVGGDVHPLEGSGPIFAVPAGIAKRPVFLPFFSSP